MGSAKSKGVKGKNVLNESGLLLKPGLCNRREHRDEGGRGFFDAKSEVDVGTSDELFKEEKARHPLPNAASHCKFRVKQLAAAAKELKNSPEIKAATQNAVKATQKVAKDFQMALAKASRSPANKALGKEVRSLLKAGRLSTDKVVSVYRNMFSKSLKGFQTKANNLTKKVRTGK